MKYCCKNIDHLLASRRQITEAKSAQERYLALMSLGRMIPVAPLERFTPQARVQGCQSLMCINLGVDDTGVSFEIYSDALISLGLAALVILEWTGLSPERILSHTGPNLTELGLMHELTPGRLNGFEALRRTIKLKLLQEYC